MQLKATTDRVQYSKMPSLSPPRLDHTKRRSKTNHRMYTN